MVMRAIAVACFVAATIAPIVGPASAGGYPSSGVLPYTSSLFAPVRHDWTGWYVGLNAGGAFGQFSTDGSGNSSDAGGFIGGAQVGAQVQIQEAVLGFEFDFQGSTQDHTDNFTVASTPVAVSASAPMFATFRGRVGWAINNVLLYATAGVPVVNASISGTALGVTASTDEWSLGWTAGGGVEWVFAQHWTSKIEYLYLDSGNIDFSIGGVPLNTRIENNIVRGGVNYYFN